MTYKKQSTTIILGLSAMDFQSITPYLDYLRMMVKTSRGNLVSAPTTLSQDTLEVLTAWEVIGEYGKYITNIRPPEQHIQNTTGNWTQQKRSNILVWAQNGTLADDTRGIALFVFLRQEFLVKFLSIAPNGQWSEYCERLDRRLPNRGESDGLRTKFLKFIEILTSLAQLQCEVRTAMAEPSGPYVSAAGFEYFVGGHTEWARPVTRQLIDKTLIMTKAREFVTKLARLRNVSPRLGLKAVGVEG